MCDGNIVRVVVFCGGRRRSLTRWRAQDLIVIPEFTRAQAVGALLSMESGSSFVDPAYAQYKQVKAVIIEPTDAKDLVRTPLCSALSLTKRALLAQGIMDVDGEAIASVRTSVEGALCARGNVCSRKLSLGFIVSSYTVLPRAMHFCCLPWRSQALSAAAQNKSTTK